MKEYEHSQVIRKLREKWGIVPTSYSGRCFLEKTERLTDSELATLWHTVKIEATTGHQYSHRGWYHQLYTDFFRGKKILDVGSGFGIDGISFALSGARVTFVDIVESNLTTLKRVCRHFGLDNHVDFHFMNNLNDLRFLDSDFDVILAMGSMHHAPHEFIRSEAHLLLEHLKPGGRWIQLAYPKSRWVKDGRPSFSKWGEITDGSGTPWSEWYSLDKLLKLLSPYVFAEVLVKEFHNNNFIWFDLAYKGRNIKVTESGNPSNMQCNSEVSETESRAMWKYRHELSKSRQRVDMLSKAIGHETLLHPYQWFQLMSFSLDFQPDLILEIGRGVGNSTSAFLEALASSSDLTCDLVSVCPSDLWEKHTLVKLRDFLAQTRGWADPLDCKCCQIASLDYRQILKKYDRILVYWAEDGFDVAQTVLAHILPNLLGKENAVIVQGISDTRYNEDYDYNGKPIWQGREKAENSLRINNFESSKEVFISLLDFLRRNRITLNSPENSYHKDFGKDIAKMEELQDLLGATNFSLQAHWHWFAFSDHSRSYFIPGK